MLTDGDRNYVLNEHLRTIAGIASKAYQRRVWIQAEGPETDDFTETVCRFFDVGDPILENHQDFKITDSQYIILKNFRDHFRAFDDTPHPYLEKDIIDTPEWTKITEIAQQVLIAFHYENTLN